MVPGTPRIAVGSFPETPAPVRRRPQNPGRSNLSQSTTLPSTPGRAENNPLLKSESKADVKKTPKPLPTRNGPGRRPQQALGPVIPVDIIDAPTQRLYAIIFFLGLQLWKMRDAHALYSGAEDDSISELTFMLKWVAFDGMFLWLLPWLRIPWLTYAPVSTLLQIAGFAVADIAIGSRIGVGRHLLCGMDCGLLTGSSWVSSPLVLSGKSYMTENCPFPKTRSSGATF